MENLIQRFALMIANGMTEAEAAQHLVEIGSCDPDTAWLVAVAVRLLSKWET
jgi:hypothetical protein